MPEFFKAWLKTLPLEQLNELDSWFYANWETSKTGIIGDVAEELGYKFDEDEQSWS